MKVRITKDRDHWLTPAKVQAFRKDTEVDVPKATADALIKAEAAEPIKPAAKES